MKPSIDIDKRNSNTHSLGSQNGWNQTKNNAANTSRNGTWSTRDCILGMDYELIDVGSTEISLKHNCSHNCSVSPVQSMVDLKELYSDCFQDDSIDFSYMFSDDLFNELHNCVLESDNHAILEAACPYDAMGNDSTALWDNLVTEYEDFNSLLSDNIFNESLNNFNSLKIYGSDEEDVFSPIITVPEVDNEITIPAIDNEVVPKFPNEDIFHVDAKEVDFTTVTQEVVPTVADKVETTFVSNIVEKAVPELGAEVEVGFPSIDEFRPEYLNIENISTERNTVDNVEKSCDKWKCANNSDINRVEDMVVIAVEDKHGNHSPLSCAEEECSLKNKFMCWNNMTDECDKNEKHPVDRLIKKEVKETKPENMGEGLPEMFDHLYCSEKHTIQLEIPCEKSKTKLSVSEYIQKYPKKSYVPKPFKYQIDQKCEEIQEQKATVAQFKPVAVIKQSKSTQIIDRRKSKEPIVRSKPEKSNIPVTYARVDKKCSIQMKRQIHHVKETAEQLAIKSLLKKIPSTGIGQILSGKLKRESVLDCHYSGKDVRKHRSRSRSYTRKRRSYSRVTSKGAAKSSDSWQSRSRSRSKSSSKYYDSPPSSGISSYSSSSGICSRCKRRICRCTLKDKYCRQRSRSRYHRNKYGNKSDRASSENSNYSTYSSCSSQSDNCKSDKFNNKHSRLYNENSNSMHNERNGSRRNERLIEEVRAEMYGNTEDFRLHQRYSRPSGSPNRLQDIDRQRRVVYIAVITPETKVSDLRKRFSKFGTIIDAKIHSRKKHDNYGFLTFRTHESAATAIKHGNDNPADPPYTLSYGEKKCFLDYYDLDCTEEVDEMITNLDFQELLEREKRRHFMFKKS